ncbi:MAG: cobaltochelatase subunit CobN [Acetobacteraceae bacterium]|nr:cobaltochelatase subunit CobN [Acetobacteraceae bacterium]
MHLLVRETHGLDDAPAAADLGLTPAPLLLLSFSDSDLGAAATAWAATAAPRPGLRLANLARLTHPMSVDLLTEGVAAQARCIVVRLLGGLEYWRYGAEELAAACRRGGTFLALVPGDGRDDAKLRALSTVPDPAWRRLDAAFTAGGPGNVRVALRLMAHLAGLAADDAAPVAPVAAWGEYPLPDTPGDVAAIVFYRSHLLAGDTAPVDALARALAARGLAPRALFADSLKAPGTAAGIAATLRDWRPRVVLNLTAFAASQDDRASPLDAAGVPVLQTVLSAASRPAWAASSHGVSQSDLAMQVALPELDGRLLTTAIAFKDADRLDPDLEYARTVLRPDPEGIALAADRALGWARLAATPAAERRVAIVLPDYPGPAREGASSGQEGYAVGLDCFASLAAILRLLRQAGYETGPAPLPDAAALATRLCRPAQAPLLAGPEYRRLFATLPESLRGQITAAWGEAEGDIRVRHVRLGNLLLAIQPDRGSRTDRRSGYHDPDRPPCHPYVAFHLWLREREAIHALVQLGTHGSVEWLPGKAVTVSAACAPAALLRGLPMIYPFIVNNPGEAAMAKRRLGAVTIGHLTPPLRRAGLHGAPAELERLIDEYAAADGLDRRRTALLRRGILARAAECGLLDESGAAGTEEDQLARLDAYVCDVKDMQIRDGLHVFGAPPDPPRRAALLAALGRSCPAATADALAASLDASPAAERSALLAGLDGRFVQPGPSGAPSRGRADVLPTGRNLFALDPRAVPTRSAVTLAERAAAELLRRHRQDHGEWPRSLVVDLWSSTTLRTGGEDLALALLLMGARPVWDEGSGRVTGIEIVPLAVLDRPRVDVTLRISGMFRDAFPAQIALFDRAVAAIAARDEAADWNPLAAAARGLAGDERRRATARIFGAAPGRYGTGLEDTLARGHWTDRAALGAQYLAGSAAAYGQGLDGAIDERGFAARIASASAFVHTQDHAEIDLLDSPDYAAHAGGFAAAAATLGAAPSLYHADASDPGAPRLRLVAEELARVVRGRAINPDWIAGQRRHGHRGAAELARTLDSLHAFAATLPTRLDRQFDLYFDATLGDPAVDAFLREANPAAHAAMRARFADAVARGLWRPRRNFTAAVLAGAA